MSVQARRKARVLVLQALYEVDCAAHPADEVIAHRLQETPVDNLTDEFFLRDIVNGVLAHIEIIDTLIYEYAPEWPLSQIAIVDRNILRIAIYELMISSQDTPAKVIANEAVELAKLFGSDSTRRFVNGVLGSLTARREIIIRHLNSRNQAL
jgi:N utilization substance protein B